MPSPSTMQAAGLEMQGEGCGAGLLNGKKAALNEKISN